MFYRGRVSETLCFTRVNFRDQQLYYVFLTLRSTDCDRGHQNEGAILATASKCDPCTPLRRILQDGAWSLELGAGAWSWSLELGAGAWNSETWSLEVGAPKSWNLEAEAWRLGG